MTRILAYNWQLRLFALGEQFVSAVSDGYRWEFWLLWVEVRWLARQQVAPSPFFVPRIVCKEVLEEPWRSLAYGLWLAYVGEH